MAGPLILAIETASGCGSVSLTRGEQQQGRILAEYLLQPEQMHSRQLLGSVETVMAATGIIWQDLTAIAVSLGPGSFTGLRIGLAAAKGLGMGTGLPVIGVPTLDALAAQMPLPQTRLWPVLDARKQQVYTASYRCDHAEGADASAVQGCCQRQSDYLVLTPEALALHLQPGDLVFGPGAALCAPWIAAEATPASQAAAIHVLTLAALQPRAALVGLCAARLLQEGQTGTSQQGALKPIPLVPLYVRASEAELNLCHTINQSSNQ